jgi:hypothetical protein
MKTKTLAIIVMCVILCCGGWTCDHGNTGTVHRYAVGIAGCGDGHTYCNLYYYDINHERLTGSGLRMARMSNNDGVWLDLYDPYNVPQGYCDNINLEGGNITGDGGYLTVTARPPQQGDDCTKKEGLWHPWHYRHQLVDRWGLGRLSNSVFFGAGGQHPHNIIPNNGCSTLDADPIEVPPSTKGHPSQSAVKALSSPTTGGAPMGASMSMIPMSMVELDPNAVELPSYGYDFDAYVVRQFDGYSRRVNEITPTDSNSWEVNYREMFPCKAEYLIALSAPEDIGGMRLDANIYTSLLPEGIDVELEVVAGNDANTVWVAHSDYFLPVQEQAYIDLMNDPNAGQVFDRWTWLTEEELPLYDPNYYDDPNDCPLLPIDPMDPDFMERHDTRRALDMQYLPCAEEDTIRFRLDFQLPVMALDKWLSTESPTADLNGDGIVNMVDYSLMFHLD